MPKSISGDSRHQARKRLSKAPKPGTFPLFRHQTGRWAKKVRGRLCYFGKVADDPDGQKALALWLEQRDDLLAGRKPREARRGALNIADGMNLYLDAVEAKIENGELHPDRYDAVKCTLEIALRTWGRNWSIEGLRPADFGDLLKVFWATGRKDREGNPVKASPFSVLTSVGRIRTAFNWLVKAGHIERLPAYGTSFDPPGKAVRDRHRDNQPARYYDRRQVRALLRASKADPRMHAAILLAINTGCQNEDIATLRLRHLDLRGGWYTQPRSKKAKRRRAKLWPRTIKALKAILAGRADAGPEALVFIAKEGGEWDGRNCLAKEFRDLKQAAGITTPRAGYQWLRHTFITEASQGGDVIAVQLACGHAARTITENYIHRIYDPRLVAIAELVDSWLTGKPEGGGSGNG